MPITPPDRRQADRQRDQLVKLASKVHREDRPSVLSLDMIKEASSVFQPRHDSIIFAPGRSQGHIAGLVKVLRSGTALDPIAVMPFGDEWYLVDGHHRLAAYRAASWAKPVPVEVYTSDLQGAARVQWGVELSFADNKKSRLDLSPTDKADGAWRAVARGSDLSKAVIAQTYGVSPRTVATMRQVKQELEDHEGAADALKARTGITDVASIASWRQALSVWKSLKSQGGAGDTDFEERRRHELARRLKPVMEVHPSPDQLAEALENYSPGIVQMMAEAQTSGDEDGDDLDI